jgi:hypothetical protein
MHAFHLQLTTRALWPAQTVGNRPDDTQFYGRLISGHRKLSPGNITVSDVPQGWHTVCVYLRERCIEGEGRGVRAEAEK